MSPASVADEAASQFAGSGLPFPALPPHLADRLERRGRWWFATEAADGTPPYALDDHVFAFLEADEPADRLLLAHAGHGAASWAVHYYVTVGPVGVFVQSAWGGAGTADEDDRQEREAMAARFAATSPLVDAAGGPGAATLGRRRLVVVDTDLGSPRWAVRSPGEPPDWKASRAPLAEAAAWLEDAS